MVALLWDYYLTTREIYPAKYLGNRIKQWLAYLKLAFPEAQLFFERIKRLRDAECIEAEFARELSPEEAA